MAYLPSRLRRGSNSHPRDGINRRVLFGLTSIFTGVCPPGHVSVSFCVARELFLICHIFHPQWGTPPQEVKTALCTIAPSAYRLTYVPFYFGFGPRLLLPIPCSGTVLFPTVVVNAQRQFLRCCLATCIERSRGGCRALACFSLRTLTGTY